MGPLVAVSAGWGQVSAYRGSKETKRLPPQIVDTAQSALDSQRIRWPKKRKEDLIWDKIVQPICAVNSNRYSPADEVMSILKKKKTIPDLASERK